MEKQGKIKLNLNALKQNQITNTTNSENKISSNHQAGEKKQEIKISLNTLKQNQSTNNINKTNDISTNSQHPIKKIEENKKENNSNINSQANIQNINNSTEKKEPIIKKDENITKTEQKIENSPKKTEETKNIQINESKNAEEMENKSNEKQENKEIFSSYTSDFAEKKEEAIKESKKIEPPKSRKTLFIAFASLFILLLSLGGIAIFKVNSPLTNKIKANVLELIGKKENKKTTTKNSPKITETWDTKAEKVLGFNIKYKVSNKNNYKIDGQIFNSKSEFENYLKNIKIKKLKIEILKKHLKEEKK